MLSPIIWAVGESADHVGNIRSGSIFFVWNLRISHKHSPEESGDSLRAPQAQASRCIPINQSGLSSLALRSYFSGALFTSIGSAVARVRRWDWWLFAARGDGIRVARGKRNSWDFYLFYSNWYLLFGKSTFWLLSYPYHNVLFYGFSAHLWFISGVFLG